jgi:hypothetical protein
MRDFLKADSTSCGGVCQTFYLFTQGVTGINPFSDLALSYCH